ncbi:uncharacterized protein LOC100848357 isoform 2 [Bos taurus]|uniref:uncharacterized protein LOC100848357 isoform 2 n=1 Tax=Bos taurus TaxID=9913 RepID=UPI00023AD00F|nr:uncharacterized protein LOC100848357 isoform 2 [Bos taurus]
MELRMEPIPPGSGRGAHDPGNEPRIGAGGPESQECSAPVCSNGRGAQQPPDGPGHKPTSEEKRAEVESALMDVPELEGCQEPGRGPAQLLRSLPSASPSAPVAPGWTSGTGCLWGRGVGMGGLTGQGAGDALGNKARSCPRV